MKKSVLIVASVGVCLTLVLVGKNIWLFTEIRALEKQRRQASVADYVTPPEWQKQIGDAGVAAGVKKLTNLNFSGSERFPEINLAWDSSLPASQKFISALQNQKLVGPALRIQMSPSTSAPGHIIAKASFQAPRKRDIQEKAMDTALAPVRNVFVSSVRPMVALMPPPRRQQGPSQKEQSRMDQERREQEEIARLENKKREIETTMVLTGIVNNGRDTMAVVDARGHPGRMWMVKTGDVMNDVRVTSIDESRGEVSLDFEGKTQVVLRLGAGGPVTR